MNVIGAVLIGCLFVGSIQAQGESKLIQKVDKLPMYQVRTPKEDWLVNRPKAPIMISQLNSHIILDNGLITRKILVQPNASTTSLRNNYSQEEFIRTPSPEAIIKLAGNSYAIGGIEGNIEKGYFQTGWQSQLSSVQNSFTLVDFSISDLKPHIPWTESRWHSQSQWKISGNIVTLIFRHADPILSNIVVKVHYGIYEDLPLISKWMTIVNESDSPIKLDHFTSEILAHPEASNYVDIPQHWQFPNLHMENDYAFSGMTYHESMQAISWEVDSTYTSQVNYPLQTPCILKSQPRVGPAVNIVPQDSFITFRTHTLLFDGTDRERNSLALRKMYRMLAPWITENPIFMHLTSTEDSIVKNAIDQCATVGYEMVILSFGSGLNMEDTSAENINRYRELADYAHNRGIELGGYSLFSSRSINEETDVIDRTTDRPGGAKFNHAPCLGSQWGLDYLEKVKYFLAETGFDLLEHDGPYPGDFCASTRHPGHQGYDDSQYRQWKLTVDFYRWLRAEGIYTNIPDFYFLSGSTKCGIGYREVNWSLPRAQQIILGRQNIYDGTWTRTPSMGWTFVPLTEYHGGGAEATLEPLADHLDAYDAHMTQNYRSGVQACYRGPRLYDTEETKTLVKSHIEHYKKYRDILNADIIHLRRPDGRDWDGIMHADTELRDKGYAVIYNPTSEKITRAITLPLYYTGIRKQVLIGVEGEDFQQYEINPNSEVQLSLTIPPHGFRWILIRKP